VTNSIDPIQVEGFQKFIQRILNEDTKRLFLEQVEKTAAEQSAESRVGYLTMINDYDVGLAWKFEEAESGIVIVTVMARLSVVQD
jgi:hypothetical protein